KPLPQAVERGTRLGLAVADVLALAAVDNEGNDALQRVALFIEQDRVDERGGKGGQGCEAQPGAALAKEQAGKREQRDRNEDGGEPCPGQQGFEGEGPVHGVGLALKQKGQTPPPPRFAQSPSPASQGRIKGADRILPRIRG